MNMPDFMAILAARAEAANPRKPGDCVGEDGLLYCGECFTPKQCRPFEENPDIIVYCACKCVKDEQERLRRRIKEREEQTKRAESMRRCFYSESTEEMMDEQHSTFAIDDSPNAEISKISRAYAKKFTKDADWLVMIGTTGVGKSFYSACICNELENAGYSCKFTSISEIEKRLWNAEEKSTVYAELARYDLLVIDDFGAERDTDYMREIQFNVIDYRLRLKKPCVITTNLSAKEIFEPKQKEMKRICSRIYERSIIVEVKGADRREAKMRSKADEKKRRLLE